MKDAVELALANNDVHFSAQTGVAQEFLNIEQSAGFTVDGVFAAPVSKQCPRNRDFGVVDGELAIRVVDGE